eukprot:1158133-Pelagomonas_calceolata.AAC.1
MAHSCCYFGACSNDSMTATPVAWCSQLLYSETCCCYFPTADWLLLLAATATAATAWCSRACCCHGAALCVCVRVRACACAVPGTHSAQLTSTSQGGLPTQAICACVLCGATSIWNSV